MSSITFPASRLDAGGFLRHSKTPRLDVFSSLVDREDKM